MGENHWRIELSRFDGDPLRQDRVDVTPNHIESDMSVQSPDGDAGNGGRGPDGIYEIEPSTLPEGGGWSFSIRLVNSMASSDVGGELCVL